MSDSVQPHRRQLPGSPIPRILQARILEWVAISFSNVWKWKVKLKSLSRVWLFATSWTAAYQAPPSMGFSRQEYRSGVPLPSLYMCVCTYIYIYIYVYIYIYLNNILQPRRTYSRNSIINTIKILLKSLIFSIGWRSSSKMSCIW